MRRALAVVFLTAACASTNNAPPRLHVEVFGQRGALMGSRTYTIRVTNTSEQVQTIHSISVHSATSSRFEFTSMPEVVDMVLQPGQSSDFPITGEVTITSGAAGDTGLAGATGDSIRVDINGQNESGTWVDSGTYTVGYVRGY